MKSLSLLVFLSVIASTSATLCYYTDNFGTRTSKICLYGCCGSTFFTVCCSYYPVRLNVGVVAGGVIGGICALAVFLAIIIIICRRRRGTVVYSSGCHTSVATVSTSSSCPTNQPYPQAAYPGQAPPVYAY